MLLSKRLEHQHKLVADLRIRLQELCEGKPLVRRCLQRKPCTVCLAGTLQQTVYCKGCVQGTGEIVCKMDVTFTPELGHLQVCAAGWEGTSAPDFTSPCGCTFSNRFIPPYSPY